MTSGRRRAHAGSAMNKSIPVSELCPPINVTGRPAITQTTQFLRTNAVFSGYFQKFVDGPNPHMDALPVFYVPGLDRAFVGPGHVGNALLATGWVEPGAEFTIWGDVEAGHTTLNRCAVTHANGMTFK